MGEPIFDIIKLEAEALDGAFSREDISVMLPEVLKLKPGNIYLEVGVDRGRSLSIVRKTASKGVKVYGVDLRVDPKVEGTTFYQGDSVEVSKTFKDKIDLLFIDGDHTYEGCKRDIEAWYPLMKPGGVMLFHDHDESSPGVVWAVAEFYYTKKPASYETFKAAGRNTSIAKITLYGGNA